MLEFSKLLWGESQKKSWGVLKTLSSDSVVYNDIDVINTARVAGSYSDVAGKAYKDGLALGCGPVGI